MQIFPLNSILLPLQDQKRTCSHVLPHKWEGFCNLLGGIKSIQIMLLTQHLEAEQWNESCILSGRNFTVCNSKAPFVMNICFLMLRIWNHRKFRLTGPWRKKMSHATLVNGPWVWVETSVTWATWALFFFQHGNMKHQRETTPCTEFHCQQDLLCLANALKNWERRKQN